MRTDHQKRDLAAFQKAVLHAQLNGHSVPVALTVTEGADGISAWSYACSDTVWQSAARRHTTATAAVCEATQAVRRHFANIRTTIDVTLDCAAAEALLACENLDPHQEGIEAAEGHRRLRMRSVLSSHRLRFTCTNDTGALMARARTQAERLRDRLARHDGPKQSLRDSHLPLAGRPPAHIVRRWANREGVTLRYTDGTRLDDGVTAWCWWESPSAWAADFRSDDTHPQATNRAEVAAAVAAIASYNGDRPLVIVCDSEVVAHSIWGHKVPAATGVELATLAHSRGVRAVLIRGHHDRRGHDRADVRARRSARRRTALRAAQPGALIAADRRAPTV